MAFTRRAQVPPLVTIHPWSAESLGPALAALAGLNRQQSASGAWPAANTAIFIPFSLTELMTALKITYLINAASGNVDAGIYSLGGTRIVSKGSTAAAGSGVWTTLDITDTILGPGTYYLAFAADNGTITLFRGRASTVPSALIGVAEMASAFPLPATVTLATPSADYFPDVMLTGRSLI